MGQRNIVVVGAGGHATSVAETVVAAGYSIAAFVSARNPGTTLLGRPVWGAIPPEHVDAGGDVVLAVGDNFTRDQEWRRLSDLVPLEQMPAVAHPSANVSRYASVGPGTVLMQGSIVGSGAQIGVGCIVNSGSIVEHECTIGDFSSLAPGATIGGRVRFGKRVALSIGAVVRHGVSIGDDTVIGAGSYVHGDVPALVVAYGTPARTIRNRRPEDGYLS